MPSMKYSDIVDYDKLDPWKEEAMERAKKTFGNPERLGISLVEESVGSTAAVFQSQRFFPDIYIAFGVEGLGTKNRVAEIMTQQIEICKKLGFDPGIDVRELASGIGQDNMAMTFNDLSSVGATPVAFEPINACGNSEYFEHVERRRGLLDGYDTGAELARTASPGGETPELRDIVYPETLDIAGGSWGIIYPRTRLTLGDRLEPGLTIYGIASSGVHANGLSLARKIAEKKLPSGYFTKLPSGMPIGKALLKPTVIYSPVIESMFDEGADIRYIQPITGHGWAKVMRPKMSLKYVIEKLPPKPEEIQLMEEANEMTDEESYKVWNNGIGLVVCAPHWDLGKISRACQRSNLALYELGYTEAGERSVVMFPINVTYRPK